MNCRDCMHFKACYEMATANGAEEFNTLFAKKCEDFADRSEWVHLPCNIGKTAYFIRNSKIIETAVEKIVIKKNGIYLKLSCNAMYETSCKSIGKTVFFDREEAKKALKEHEIND